MQKETVKEINTTY